MSVITDLRQAIGRAVDELGDLTDNATAFASKEQEIAELEAKLGRAVAVENRQRALARPAGDGTAAGGTEEDLSGSPDLNHGFSGSRSLRRADGSVPGFDEYVRHVRHARGMTVDRTQHFHSFGEQLQAIFQYYTSRGTNVDSRLVRAPTGASEVDATGGGFLVQVDFANSVFMLAHDMGEMIQRVGKLPIGPNSNGIKIPAVDETSRATGSRWGGVQSYWVGEGTTANNTKPKFRLVEFDLKKLMSTMYVTDEMVQDATALTSIASKAFSEEIMFMTEDAIFEGTGAGQPLGVMKSPALVTVAAEKGQAATTLVKENIDNMWKACWARSRKNAVWFINQDIEANLNQLNQAVGTGGQLVYLPPGGLSGAPYATLYGRPVVATEYNNTLGTAGDILLADLSQYNLADKGGVQAATSMHVAFLTDEMVFRITYRVDGKPMWHSTMTPFKGSVVKSPFVTVASR